MILRKPYAFLIKYFKKINILLLVLVGYIFYTLTKFHKFTDTYYNSGVYNSEIDSISNYTNTTIIAAFIGIIIISLILLVLLKKKQKPFFAYLYIVVVNAVVLGFLIYCRTYFLYKAVDGFELVTVKTINDLSFITSLPYYPILLILLIRGIGLDLKNFGFQEDKEYFDISEEDREEIEVQVGFDKQKWIRKIKYYLRNTKYFVLEHKLYLSIILVIMLLFGTFQFYQYFYVKNRIYKTNETVSSNNYKLTVKNTYLTNKDFSGKVIAKDGVYFLLVDLQIENLVASERVFDIEKLLLYIDDDFYVPTARYNEYFKDMGNLFKKMPLKGYETTSYLIIYEVPEFKKSDSLVLKYQQVLDESKLIQIKIKVKDISEYKSKGEQQIGNKFTIPLNEQDSMSFTLSDLKITDSVNYTYQSCKSSGECPITQGIQNAEANKKILYTKIGLVEKTKQEFLDFLRTYAKVRYKVGEESKTTSIKYAVTNSYKGNYLYLSVPSDIENATSIDLIFTVRSYQYVYHLKGE